MHTITFNRPTHAYDPVTRTFTISEKDVPFATTYELLNPLTKNTKVFEFTHSTGPEFAADTKWIYKSEDDFTLEVCNDPEMVKVAAAAYLKAKTRH